MPELVPPAQADFPSFDELYRMDATFFRRGAAHAHRDEMPQELHELFWAQAENATATQRLGYER